MLTDALSRLGYDSVTEDTAPMRTSSSLTVGSAQLPTDSSANPDEAVTDQREFQEQDTGISQVLSWFAHQVTIISQPDQVKFFMRICSS